MTTRKQVTTALILLTTLSVAALMHTRRDAVTFATPTVQEKIKRDDLPVTDISVRSKSDEKSMRRAKSSRYDYKGDEANIQRFRLKESGPEDVFELPISHAPATPAIPVTQSDAVIVGVVADAQAFLSADETSVYSEFLVSIEDVLKNTSSQPVAATSSITLERRGGAVRFPSGKVLRRGKFVERMPLINKRYVFFLKSQDEVGSFDIITGYELRDGKVFPLDGVDTSSGGIKLPQFAAYEGVDESKFLQQLLNVIHQSTPDTLPSSQPSDLRREEQ